MTQWWRTRSHLHREESYVQWELLPQQEPLCCSLFCMKRYASAVLRIEIIIFQIICFSFIIAINQSWRNVSWNWRHCSCYSNQGNDTHSEHVSFVWDHFISKAPAKKVFIVANGSGGQAVLDLVFALRNVQCIKRLYLFFFIYTWDLHSSCGNL